MCRTPKAPASLNIYIRIYLLLLTTILSAPRGCLTKLVERINESLPPNPSTLYKEIGTALCSKFLKFYYF